MVGFPGQDQSPQPWLRRRESPVYGTNGMVAAAHPLTVAAGLDVLARGGNAVDAAVAAAAVASVVMPEMCGLGGDLFALVSKPGQPVRAFLGSGIAPRGASIEQMRAAGAENGTKMPYQGPLSIGVPGMVDAYFTLLREFGTRTFAELSQRAITHAGDGFPLTHDGAHYIASQAPLLTSFPSSAAVFFPGGVTLKEGEIFKQSNLARTLQELGEHGADHFYRGSLAKRISDGITSLGGAISTDDLAGHKTTVNDPLATTYRGHTVYQTGLPTQGLILLEALNVVEALGEPKSGAEEVHALVEAKKIAYADRLGYAADPAFYTTPIEVLLSKSWAAKRAAAIDPNRASTVVPPGGMQDGDTTYLNVVDRDGMMVSLIQSVSSAFGSGVVAGDTGVVMNNRVGRGFSLVEGHPNIYAPGKKTMHTLNCFLVTDQNGEVVLTGGTPGGDGQPQWNLQMITGMIDHAWDVQAAIEAPRWTSFPGTDPGWIDNPFELRVEDRLGTDEIEALKQKGHNVVVQGSWNGGGAAQLIARDPKTGVLAGGSDPRAEGFAAGF
jgi:gamma-glutamyltranspeptidase/glutathione hydrolase